MSLESLAEVRAAARPTTFIESDRLRRRLGVNVTIASETFQRTGSFKFRAAFHVAAQAPQQRIICASSGNFGQALAFACRMLGKSCVVVMPSSSARVKVDAVREFGGQVDLVDVAKISRAERVRELAALDPDAYVASAYDDDWVIAGNSTLGIELVESRRDFAAVVAPVGGGGLTAGLIQGLNGCGARTRVYGAEPLLANDAARSLRAGRRIVDNKEPDTQADGARTIGLGQRNWPILQQGLGGIVEVTEDQIREAVRLLFTLANLKCEPTGALGIGALLAAPDQFRDQSVCCVISGGNVDPKLFCEMIQAS